MSEKTKKAKCCPLCGNVTRGMIGPLFPNGGLLIKIKDYVAGESLVTEPKKKSIPRKIIDWFLR